VLCFKCGHDNPLGVKFCEKCNAMLPKFATTVAPAAKAPRTAKLKELLEAGEKFIAGEIAEEEYLKRLNALEEHFLTSEQGIKTINVPKELVEDVKPQLELALEGIDCYKRAIAKMKAVVLEKAHVEKEEKKGEEEEFQELPEEHIEAIKEAMRLAQEGNDLLNECIQISEENIRKLKEEEFLYEDDSTVL